MSKPQRPGTIDLCSVHRKIPPEEKGQNLAASPGQKEQRLVLVLEEQRVRRSTFRAKGDVAHAAVRCMGREKSQSH